MPGHVEEIGGKISAEKAGAGGKEAIFPLFQTVSMYFRLNLFVSEHIRVLVHEMVDEIFIAFYAYIIPF